MGFGEGGGGGVPGAPALDLPLETCPFRAFIKISLLIRRDTYNNEFVYGRHHHYIKIDSQTDVNRFFGLFKFR